jgi:small subunit ribosomal protein S6
MRPYEVVFIVRPDLDDDGYNAVVEKVKELLTGDGGEVTNVDKWGRRNLAYPVRKFTEGLYVLVHAQLAPAQIGELDRELRLNEQIIRHLIVRMDV